MTTDNPLRATTNKRDGAFLLHKEATNRHPHQTFEAAEREAVRLLRGMPGETFVITLEVARVKLKPAAEAPFAIGEVPQ
ncbi:hypothetical protein H5J25_13705 [Sphingomonas aliaeris]|uniref:Uncharacterized protein n=1 Tax=Sphingomonas aliaeris TaxID=2759526 RepID=A0A974NT92_9SPHN|nr:hypothetical protein [Sphingomonas aliaeris]QQV76500.1 hypothetical protein H5J25_13705 [Sphingomonas aliaeris]